MEGCNVQEEERGHCGLFKSRTFSQTKKVSALFYSELITCMLYNPFRHRAMNLFLQEYSSSWLSKCHSSNMENLCEEIIVSYDLCMHA